MSDREKRSAHKAWFKAKGRKPKKKDKAAKQGSEKAAKRPSGDSNTLTEKAAKHPTGEASIPPTCVHVCGWLVSGSAVAAATAKPSTSAEAEIPLSIPEKVELRLVDVSLLNPPVTPSMWPYTTVWSVGCLHAMHLVSVLSRYQHEVLEQHRIALIDHLAAKPMFNRAGFPHTKTRINGSAQGRVRLNACHLACIIGSIYRCNHSHRPTLHL